MEIQIRETDLPDVLLVERDAHRDDRGFFVELYRRDVFRDAGLPPEFAQLNLSGSRRGVVRGLHFQWDPPMGKLMRVARGRAFLVAVDLRRGSPRLGDWVGFEHDARDHAEVWAPPGFARGFCALSDLVEIEYLCTVPYRADGEAGIRWDDPEVGIEWPVTEPVLSERDRTAPTLREWLERPESAAFRFRDGGDAPAGAGGP